MDLAFKSIVEGQSYRRDCRSAEPGLSLLAVTSDTSLREAPATLKEGPHPLVHSD